MLNSLRERERERENNLVISLNRTRMSPPPPKKNLSHLMTAEPWMDSEQFPGPNFTHKLRPSRGNVLRHYLTPGLTGIFSPYRYYQYHLLDISAMLRFEHRSNDHSSYSLLWIGVNPVLLPIHVLNSTVNTAICFT